MVKIHPDYHKEVLYNKVLSLFIHNISGGGIHILSLFPQLLSLSFTRNKGQEFILICGKVG